MDYELICDDVNVVCNKISNIFDINDVEVLNDCEDCMSNINVKWTSNNGAKLCEVEDFFLSFDNNVENIVKIFKFDGCAIIIAYIALLSKNNDEITKLSNSLLINTELSKFRLNINEKFWSIIKKIEYLYLTQNNIIQIDLNNIIEYLILHFITCNSNNICYVPHDNNNFCLHGLCNDHFIHESSFSCGSYNDTIKLLFSYKKFSQNRFCCIIS